MHALLRPAGDQMYDTRTWRGPAVVGGDGIDRRYPLSQRNTPQAVEDFCFCALAPLRHAGGPRLCLLVCRFSDAGMTRLSTRCGGPRPKSAKARNRGKWGTGGAAGAYGDLAAVR